MTISTNEAMSVDVVRQQISVFGVSDLVLCQI